MDMDMDMQVMDMVMGRAGLDSFVGNQKLSRTGPKTHKHTYGSHTNYTSSFITYIPSNTHCTTYVVEYCYAGYSARTAVPY